MTKAIFKKANFVLLTLSIICLGVFLWLSNNYKDNIILWFFVPLVIFSYIYSVYDFFKNKRNFSNEKIDYFFIKEVFNLVWKTDKSAVLSFICQEIVFISIAFLYYYGYLVIPFCFFTFTNFIQTSIEKVDKKTI